MNHFSRLLSPSLLSGFIAVTIGLLVEGTAVAIALSGSALNQELFSAHQASAGTFTDYHTILNNLGRYQFINDLPIYLFWIGNGVVVYLLTMWVYRGLAKGVRIEHELKYVHINQKSLLMHTMIDFCIRVITTICGLFFIKYSFDYLLPYALKTAHTFATAVTIVNFAFTLLSVVLIIVACGVITVGLRLLALRYRLFST
jgi:hypothetical protein